MYLNTNVMDVDSSDKVKKVFQENPSLSQQQNRVYYKKYINEINQALQSLITVGRLKRMELLSINNRALFNRGKVQRCEWVAKKHLNPNSTFLPDVKNLNLDNRLVKNDSKIKKRNKTQTKSSNTSRFQQKFIDMLIQEQLTKMKENNLLTLNRSQQQIVKQACKAIQQKIILKTNQTKKNIEKLQNLFRNNRSTMHNKFAYLRKDHRRSVTETIYFQQIQQIERKNQAIMKQRQQEKRIFLRKMRLSNKKKR